MKTKEELLEDERKNRYAQYIAYVRKYGSSLAGPNPEYWR